MSGKTSDSRSRAANGSRRRACESVRTTATTEAPMTAAQKTTVAPTPFGWPRRRLTSTAAPNPAARGMSSASARTKKAQPRRLGQRASVLAASVMAPLLSGGYGRVRALTIAHQG